MNAAPGRSAAQRAPLRITTIVGARPQFIKAAAVSRAIERRNAAGDGPAIHETIVHTGQHYDDNMSRVFFDQLQIPTPGHHLEVGSAGHAEQTAAMLERIERVLNDDRPDWVLVYGDTNSTLAGALAAAKLHVLVAHVEAGLRSFNRRMPEEINRICADVVSSLLFCPTQTAVENLAREGITNGVHRTGDVMYDSVLFYTSLAERQSTILHDLGLEDRSYLLATVHRAENTDDRERLAGILGALGDAGRPVVLPLHPRTRAVMREGATGQDDPRRYEIEQAVDGQAQPLPHGRGSDHLAGCHGHARRGRAGEADHLAANVRLIDPAPYLDMLMLEKNAAAILTDSGGMQKEAYWFGVPCVTLREETEWTELVDAGVNRLAGADPERIREAVDWATTTGRIDSSAQLYGDGRAAEAIVDVLARTGVG